MARAYFPLTRIISRLGFWPPVQSGNPSAALFSLGFGPELLTNGDLSAAGSPPTIYSGVTQNIGSLTCSGAAQIATWNPGLVTGQQYRVCVKIACTTSGVNLRLTNDTANNTNVVGFHSLIVDSVTRILILDFIAVGPYVTLEADGAVFSGTVYNVSATQLLSNLSVTLSPATGHLVFTGYQPAITTTTAVSPATGHLTFGGKVPSVSVTFAVSPSTGHLIFGGKVPTVVPGVNVNPSTGHLVFTGHVPALTFTTAVSPATGHLSFGGKIPSVALNVNVVPATGHLIFAGHAPNLSLGIVPLTGHLVFTGYVPDVSGAVVSSSAVPLKVQYRHRGRNG